MFIKIRVDMRLLDQLVLGIITSRINPETGKASLILPDICEAGDLAYITARRSVKRLESLGYIKRHNPRGRGKTEFEVLKNA